MGTKTDTYTIILYLDSEFVKEGGAQFSLESQWRVTKGLGVRGNVQEKLFQPMLRTFTKITRASEGRANSRTCYNSSFAKASAIEDRVRD